MIRPIKAVVFDLDGTLVDSMPLVLRAYAHAVQPYIPDITDSQLRSRMGGPPDRILAGLLRESEHLGDALRRLTDFGSANWSLIQPFPRMVEMLDQLRESGVKVGLWTGRERRSTELIMAQTGITQKMDTCVCGDDMLSHKPDPAGLAEALRRLEVTAADAVFVGDAEVDLLAGAALAVRTMLITHGYAVSAELGSKAWQVVETPLQAYGFLHDAVDLCTKNGGTSELS